MIKKIIGEPHLKNERLKKIITETKINYFYIKNHKDFKDRIINDISVADEVWIWVGQCVINLNL